MSEILLVGNLLDGRVEGMLVLQELCWGHVLGRS
jgi:hypothetical protein